MLCSIPSTMTKGSAFCKVLIPRIEMVPGTLPGILFPRIIVTPGIVPEKASCILKIGRFFIFSISICDTEDATCFLSTSEKPTTTTSSSPTSSASIITFSSDLLLIGISSCLNPTALKIRVPFLPSGSVSWNSPFVFDEVPVLEPFSRMLTADNRFPLVSCTFPFMTCCCRLDMPDVLCSGKEISSFLRLITTVPRCNM